MKKVLALLLCVAMLLVCLPVTISAAENEITPLNIKPNSPSNNSWLTILLVALVCFSASITTSVIVLKMKKKGKSE